MNEIYTITNWELPIVPKGAALKFNEVKNGYVLDMQGHEISLVLSHDYIAANSTMFINRDEFDQLEKTQNLLLLTHYIPLLYRHAVVVNSETKVVTMLNQHGEIFCTDLVYDGLEMLYKYVVNYYSEYVEALHTWQQCVQNIPFNVYYGDEVVEGSPFTVINNFSQVQLHDGKVYDCGALVFDKKYIMQYDLQWVIKKFNTST